MIRIDFSQYDAFVSKLVNHNYKSAYSKIGKYTVLEIQSEFNSQRTFSGQSWAPASKTTLRRRKSAGRSSTKALIDTYKLYNSIIAVHESNHVHVDVGDVDRDADLMNKGGFTKLNNRDISVPARPFMPLESEVPDRWLVEYKLLTLESIAEVLK